MTRKESNHAGGPLQRVAIVFAVRVVGHIGQTTTYDDPTQNGVKQDRNKYEAPFDDGKQFSQSVDLVDQLLTRSGRI